MRNVFAGWVAMSSALEVEYLDHKTATTFANLTKLVIGNASDRHVLPSNLKAPTPLARSVTCSAQSFAE